MDWYRLTVTLHVLAAVVWAGGQLFIAAVMVPLALRLEPGLRAQLIGQMGRRFRWVSWLMLLTLVGTGLAQSFEHWGLRPGYIASSDFFAVVKWRLLTAKVSLVALVLALSALHDFALGPRLVRLQREAAGQGQAARLRKAVSWLARVNVALTVTIVVLAVLIAR
ncbi:MAG: CopD family protein [Chloroflexi bacterium]|nr:CopD family protein [Chloroflexota bacterium]